MKFFEGNWGIKEKMKADFPVEVFDWTFDHDQLMIYCPFRHIVDKGKTLNTGMMTIEFCAYQDEIIGIRMFHHQSGIEQRKKFPLVQNHATLDFEETDSMLILRNQRTKIEIIKEDLTIKYYYDGNLKTESRSKSKLYVEETTSQKSYVAEQLSIGIDEKIYGFGEQFTEFVKNGQSIKIWNEDGGTGTEQAYKNIPFYVTSKQYGVFVNHPENVEFEVGSEKAANVQFSVEGEVLEYYFVPGTQIKDVLRKYTQLVGGGVLPPAWTFGLWLSTSFLTKYDETTVLTFIDKMIEQDLPFDVFHFDCMWMKPFEWCNFTWDKQMFPDPAGLIQKIKQRNLKVCLWINPYIAQKSPLFVEGDQKGFLLKNLQGNTWQCDKWQAGQGIVDFTNPAAKDWYQSYLRTLIRMGIDSFKTDFGERIPTDVRYFDGSSPKAMHNYYTYLYNEAVFEVLQEEVGESEAVVFARSATSGCQKFPVHWGGDCTPDYYSMHDSLRAGLSFGLSGFQFWSHDIGGFESGCDPDIYKRWTQFGLLSSHSRYHGSKEYKVPWLYGEEAVAVTRRFSKLKIELMPYIWKEACLCVQQGLPFLRPMILEFENDPSVKNIDTQYMFGERILIAPIFNKEGKVWIYLPAGRWFNYLDNEVVEGNRWVQRTYDYFHLPMFIRQNSLLITGQGRQAVYDYSKDLTIHVYELSEDRSLEEAIYSPSGKKIGGVTVSYSGTEMLVHTKGLTNCSIVYHGTKAGQYFERTYKMADQSELTVNPYQ